MWWCLCLAISSSVRCVYLCVLVSVLALSLLFTPAFSCSVLVFPFTFSLALVPLRSCVLLLLLFFFKQKTAYDGLISDWSSDVCSSDRRRRRRDAHGPRARSDGGARRVAAQPRPPLSRRRHDDQKARRRFHQPLSRRDRPARARSQVGSARHRNLPGGEPRTARSGRRGIQGRHRTHPHRQDRKSTRLNSSH